MAVSVSPVRQNALGFIPLMRACNGSSTPAISLNGMPSGECTLGLGQYRQGGLFRPFTRKAETGDKCVEDEGKDG
jgi:hypothetical protein